MIFHLLLSLALAAHAENFGLYAMEDSQIRIGTECLPQSVKDSVKNEGIFTTQRNSYIDQIHGEKQEVVYETRFTRLSPEKEIAKACGLEGLQAYFSGKLHPLSGRPRFRYILSEKDDCGYSVPRVDVAFEQNPLREAFLLGPGFSVMKEKERRKAEKDFKAAKGVDWKMGFPREYFFRAGEAFMVFDETEMGTKLSLYRLRGKKAEVVDGAYFEPCGS